jgi:hypothetical protein
LRLHTTGGKTVKGYTDEDMTIMFVSGLVLGVFVVGLLILLLSPPNHSDYILHCYMRHPSQTQVFSMFVMNKEFTDETDAEIACHEEFGDDYIVEDSTLLRVEVTETEALERFTEEK